MSTAKIREMMATYGRSMSVIQAKRLKADVLAEVEAIEEAAAPIRRFVEAFDARPVRGIEDILYGVHGGDAHADRGGADIRLSDLRKVAAIGREEPK